MSSNVTFLRNCKGNEVLWMSGYRHTFAKNNKESTLWRCQNRKCKGSVTWDGDNAISRLMSHQCEPNIVEFQFEKLMSGLRKEVCENLGPIPKVFNDFLKEYRKKEGYDGTLPDFFNVKDSLYRARRKYLQLNT